MKIECLRREDSAQTVVQSTGAWAVSRFPGCGDLWHPKNLHVELKTKCSSHISTGGDSKTPFLGLTGGRDF